MEVYTLITKAVQTLFKESYHVDLEDAQLQIQRTRKDFEGDLTLVVFPLLGTATGRIFLTYLPELKTRALAGREGALYPDLAARREAMVAGIRTAGVSISEGYLFRGFCAISAPDCKPF